MATFSFGRVLVLVSCLMFLGAFAAYVVNPHTRIELSQFDWAAAGALGTFLAAAFTAWAAWAATEAAKAALAIDQRQSERLREAKARSMIVIAYSLDQELDVLEMLMGSMSTLPLPQEWPDHDAERLFASYYSGTQLIRIPLLERFVDRYADFDGLTAARLVKTLTGALEMKARPASWKVASFEDALKGIKALIAHAENLKAECVQARGRLAPYVNAMRQLDGAVSDLISHH